MRTLAILVLGLSLVLAACDDSPKTTYHGKYRQDFYEPPGKNGGNKNPRDVNPPLSDDEGQNVSDTPSADQEAEEEIIDTAPSLSLAELESLQMLIGIMFDYSLGVENKDQPKTLFEMVQALTASNQEPTMMDDDTPDIGKMTIIRTFRPLFGTRYFHVQYFSDADTPDTLQHISFEIRPGAGAWEQTQSMIKIIYPALAEPQEKSKHFIMWRLPKGYVIYIKRLSREDIDDHPFNAYQESDIGIISIALEQDPHSEEHSEEDSAD